MNNITVVGNSTREPELRYGGNGVAVVKGGMAVNRSWNNRNGEKQEETSFFNFVAFGPMAENVAESIQSGTRIIVSGRLQSRSWETDDGQKRTVLEIVAEEIAPSLRFATAAITKTQRSGPSDVPQDSEDA